MQQALSVFLCFLYEDHNGAGFHDFYFENHGTGSAVFLVTINSRSAPQSSRSSSKCPAGAGIYC